MASVHRLKMVVEPKTGATETIEAMPTMRVEEAISSVAHRHPKVFNLIGLAGYELVVTTSVPMVWLDRKECIGSYWIDPEQDVLQLVSRTTRKAICGSVPQFRSTPGAASLSKVIVPEQSFINTTTNASDGSTAAAATTLVAGLNSLWDEGNGAQMSPSVCDLIPDEAKEYIKDPYRPAAQGAQTAFSIVSPLDFETFSGASESGGIKDMGGDSDSEEEEGGYEEITKRGALTVRPPVSMNELAKSPIASSLSTKEWEREISQYELLLWPNAAPFVHKEMLFMKVLVPHLKMFKTLVFDPFVCVEDAVVLIWEDLFVNHSWDVGSHWTLWTIAEQGDDRPLNYGLLLANALKHNSNAKPWWMRTFCFVRRGCEPFVDVVGGNGYDDDDSSSDNGGIDDDPDSPFRVSVKQRSDCICIVSFPEDDEKVIFSAFTALPLRDIVTDAHKQTRYGKQQFDVTMHTILVVGVQPPATSESESPFTAVAVHPDTLLSECLRDRQSTVVIECRLKPQQRSLHVVFGISHCVRVALKADKSFGTYFISGTSTVDDMIYAITTPPNHAAQMRVTRCVDRRRPCVELARTCPLCSLRLAEGEELSFGSSVEAAIAPVSNPKLKDPDPPLLRGEEKYVTIHASLATGPHSPRINGLFLLTSYRIIFSDQGKPVAEIPLAMICGVTRGSQASALIITSKDVRISVFFMGQGDLDRIIKSLRLGTKELIYNSFIPRSTSDAFAWANADAYSAEGWGVYNIHSEFGRIGFVLKDWRVTEANKDFTICDTYPRRFIVPRAISDDDITEIAKFRARGRIPVVCWVHPSGASLSRCAQPVVKFAVSKRRCPQDEKFIRTLIDLAPRSKTLYIFDARANIAATANKVSGKGGTETDAQAYPNCVLNFLDIGNIHALRESYFKLWDLCIQRQTPYWEATWLRSFVATGWLDHVYHILRGSAWMSELLSRGCPVITHCSDGWDRTPQLSSLCQIMQDHFFSKTNQFRRDKYTASLPFSRSLFVCLFFKGQFVGLQYSLKRNGCLSVISLR